MTTTYTQRTKPSTSWNERDKIIKYISLLQDSVGVVQDDTGEDIYIYTDTGTPVSGTQRSQRPTI